MRNLGLLVIFVMAQVASAAPIYKGDCLVYTEPVNDHSGPTVLAQERVELEADVDKVLYTDSLGRSYHAYAYQLGGNAATPVLSLSIKQKGPRPTNVLAELVGPIEPVAIPDHGLTLIAPAINNMNCRPAK